VGYDVELVQIGVPAGTKFPVEGATAKKLRAQAGTLADPKVVRVALLGVAGCRPGPSETIDFLGRGLNYARFAIRRDAIHVDNNCSAIELLKVYQPLTEVLANLLIFDLQSQQLHDAESFRQWWARPL